MSKKLEKIIKNFNCKTKALALEILDSPIKWDLLNFYQTNPFSIHTAQGLANIIGRSPDQVFIEAEELASASVLKRISRNGDKSSIYSYEPAAKVASLIKILFELHNEEHDLLDKLEQLIKDSQNR
ncbi:MAG: hypothetical protein COW32_01425 [Candidatus Aquicultor secundus]|uniref:Transcriptional regulator n=1 Tax=Candidatus Aquicultor secundus TaxID=1973895 RepID=A0A2M7TBJ7_9ACTN|nr:hypothetical protein [Candidatus Aquicultor secundus]NCO66237.1 hypothetical protein [Solirubrobacter sp.]OIO84199.1 MAG: hypothetical protein AUK32_09020 [Candidatus Aquicultor secundus]PIU26376.1 MAG: hypothetical protein COT10_08980 [Candidatus Aquicultor secundus]PIW23037.1 MAG: hypothetical protein COW32_01425 [Candidatus Aquicultor secundus]PIX52692.1 MAG: hypothetical protein COZ51_02840 [Candidatus Aquicultor secundus]